MFGAARGLETGVVAERLDQRCGVGQRAAAIDEKRRHATALIHRRYGHAHGRGERRVNHKPVAPAPLLCHAVAMNRPVPVAGGFFLIVPIVIGFLWGVPAGRSMQGALIGLGIGLALAVVVWLIDRRRS